VIGGGVWFFFAGPKAPISYLPPADATREHERIAFSPDEEPTGAWEVDMGEPTEAWEIDMADEPAVDDQTVNDEPAQE
jgi:hypothetical protein